MSGTILKLKLLIAFPSPIDFPKNVEGLNPTRFLSRFFPSNCSTIGLEYVLLKVHSVKYPIPLLSTVKMLSFTFDKTRLISPLYPFGTLIFKVGEYN
ncbi:MAG: hypothetical protein EOO34_00860 [Cyanobacteriota bacterium]|nr:MAG: hypothetical protein EOO34_00860 [Cyanobacteriota bacterium]